MSVGVAINWCHVVKIHSNAPSRQRQCFERHSSTIRCVDGKDRHVVCIFRSRRTDHSDAEYEEWSARMDRLVAAIPGTSVTPVSATRRPDEE